MIFEVKTRLISRETLRIEAKDEPDAEMTAIALFQKGGMSIEPSFEIISVKELKA